MFVPQEASHRCCTHAQRLISWGSSHPLDGWSCSQYGFCTGDSSRLGRRNLVVYLASLVLGALGFALLIDYAFPREWFTHFSTPTDACHHIETPWFQWASTLLLGALLIYTFIVLPLWRKLYPQNNFAFQQSEDEASFVRKFSVEGMTCNHCRNHVEKAILGVEGGDAGFGCRWKTVKRILWALLLTKTS